MHVRPPTQQTKDRPSAGPPTRGKLRRREPSRCGVPQAVTGVVAVNLERIGRSWTIKLAVALVIVLVVALIKWWLP
jgi:hypothetical protein